MTGSSLCPRYALRTADQAEVCDDLALMLADTLVGELSDVGPEDILEQHRMDGLQHALAQQVGPARAHTNKSDTHLVKSQNSFIKSVSLSLKMGLWIFN